MPYILDKRTGQSSYGSLRNVKYPYKYPLKMDLRPGSVQHDRILSYVLSAAQKSRDAMSPRFATWQGIDQTLTAYISLDEKERILRGDDERKPVSTVVPISYATLDTILTYLVGAFMQSPILRYEGVGPEDTFGAMLMERVIDLQMQRFKAGLRLHTMFRDMLAYGFGIVSPIWTRQMGYRTRAAETSVFDSVRNMLKPTGYQKQRQKITLFEGNELHNIDPYKTFLDPLCSIGDIQKSRYIGWLRTESLYDLIERESWDDSLFNVKYLQHIDCRSVFGADNSKRDKNYVRQDFTLDDTMRYSADILYFYVDIIPEQMGLGSFKEPEKWIFGVAGDSVVVSASPVNLDHNMFPACVAAAEYDGYSPMAIARLEVVQGMQTFINFLYNSHMTNVRKAINDMFVVDPELVNINDLRNPAPGKLIRLRKKAWGKGIQDAISQLKVQDITQANLSDAAIVTDILEKVVGTPDLLQGVMRNSAERRSATEFRETKGSALGRLERIAWVSSLQAISNLAYMVASQTQQFMSQDQYVKIVGRGEQELRTIFGDSSHVLVDPLSILIDYDVISGSAMLPSSGDANQWAAMFQIISAQPALLQQFDVVRIFQYWARLSGAKNIEDFRQLPQMQAQVLPDEEVLRQTEAGNLIPMSEAV